MAALALLAALVVPIAAAAQDNWTEPLTKASPPNPPFREASAMAYDPIANQTIVFGGRSLPYGANQTIMSDTWLWDGTTWTQLFPTNVPPARWRHGMAFDGQHIVMYGGYDANTRDLGDTWTWDAQNRNWVFRTNAGPPGRSLFAMAEDPVSQNVVLYGGISALGPRYADTWVWDGQAGTWTSPTLTNTPQPPALLSSAMAFDGAHIVMYGGVSSGCPVADMWMWNGDWVQLPAGAPGVRDTHSMAYDAANHRALVFGGQTTTNCFSGAATVELNDTWAWDGTTWTQLQPAATPPPTDNGSMAYDAAHQQTVLFGGEDVTYAQGYLGATDTWLFGQAATTQVTVNVPSTLTFSLDGTPYTGSQTLSIVQGTHALSTSSPQVLTAGQSQAVFVSWDDGGAETHDITVGSSAMTITATFKTQYFVGASISPAGAGTIAPASAYVDASTVLDFSETAYPGATFTGWSGDCSGAGLCEITVTRPMGVTANFAIANVTVTINVPTGVQFTFNGTTYTGSQTLSVSPGAYSLSTASPQSLGTGVRAVWQSWSDNGAQAHQIIAPATVTGMFKTQYLVTAGVGPAPDNQGTTSGAGWYDAGTQATVTATASPGSAFYYWDAPTCCFHAAEPSLTSTITAPWTVTAHFGIQQNWVQFFPSSSPDPRDGSALAFCWNSVIGVRAVLFGGINKTGKTLGETWIWDGTTWTATATAAGAVAPSPRSGASMVTSFTASGNPALVLFGGKDAKGAVLSDTWQWDCSANTWTQMQPTTIPPPRSNAAIGPDGATIEGVVMFGGQNNSGFLGDTWRWDGTNWMPLQPPQSPAPRANATMDQNEFARPYLKNIIIGLSVLFGGNGIVNGNPVNFSDVWQWDPTKVTWIQQTSLTPPPTTTGPIATNVLTGQELLLGVDGTTWGYDGLAWVQEAPATIPPARGGEGLAWNRLNLTGSQILMFGGHASASGAKLNDTWMWLTPSIGLTPQGVSLVKSGSSYIVTVTVQDTGNVPDGSIVVTSATLGSAAAKSTSSISVLNPTATGSVTAKFPASSVGAGSGFPVPVTLVGTYSANGVSGYQWVWSSVVALP